MCIQLASDVDRLRSGVIKAVLVCWEELSQHIVAVEEMPSQEIRSRGDNYTCAATYNIEAVKENEYQVTCYKDPYADVRYKLLCHNHMMSVIRVCITKAKRDLPTNEKKDKHIVCCDAVAESLNGKVKSLLLL